MRKLICALICLFVLFSFAGCKDTNKAKGDGVDIEYYVNLGAIPESDIKIGDKEPESTNENEDYFFSENGNESYFSNGDFVYYYDSSKKDATVKAISAFSKFYGFEIGAVTIEISDLLEAQELEYTERAPKTDELFFLPSTGNFSVIEYKAQKHTLLFVFQDNSLCAAYLE